MPTGSFDRFATEVDAFEQTVLEQRPWSEVQYDDDCYSASDRCSTWAAARGFLMAFLQEVDGVDFSAGKGRVPVYERTLAAA